MVLVCLVDMLLRGFKEKTIDRQHGRGLALSTFNRVLNDTPSPSPSPTLRTTRRSSPPNRRPLSGFSSPHWAVSSFSPSSRSSEADEEGKVINSLSGKSTLREVSHEARMRKASQKLTHCKKRAREFLIFPSSSTLLRCRICTGAPCVHHARTKRRGSYPRGGRL